MAIKNVICRGYGPSASIPFVVTRGYSIGAAVSETTMLHDFTLYFRRQESFVATVKTKESFDLKVTTDDDFDEYLD